MTENNKLSPPKVAVDASRSELAIPRKIGIPALHQRLKSPTASADDPASRPNRIALMLDASGSMNGSDGNNPNYTEQQAGCVGHRKIEHLREAVTSFINSCNMRDTAVAIESFGDQHRSRLALTCFQPLLLTTAMSIEAQGSTPLHEAMDFVLMTYSVTRGVIVSDGNADSPSLALDCAGRFAEAGIPVDTVHIGTSSCGEDLLKQIAERTNGKFIKFTDIASFAKNFKYLTPVFYAQLTSGSITATQLGAKEVK